MSSSPTRGNTNAERRRYYRVEDRIALKYRVVAESELPLALSRLQGSVPDRAMLPASFATTSNQLKHLGDRIKRGHPDIGQYLEVLNEKMDSLVRIIAATENDAPLSASHDVSLSASGLAFRASSPVNQGENLELRILIFPSQVNLNILATVVYCREEPIEGGHFPFCVGVDFSFVRENDRDLLIKHILQKQSEALRRERLSSENQPAG